MTTCYYISSSSNPFMIFSSAKQQCHICTLLHDQCNSVQLKRAQSGRTLRSFREQSLCSRSAPTFIDVIVSRLFKIQKYTKQERRVIAIFISLETNSKTDCSKKTKQKGDKCCCIWRNNGKDKTGIRTDSSEASAQGDPIQQPKVELTFLSVW